MILDIAGVVILNLQARPGGLGLAAGDGPQELAKVIIEDTGKDSPLGPTGARGWMHVERMRLTPQDFTEDMSTALARQILVTAVEEGSPADGVLAVGYVILGIGAEPFDMDARRALGNAINEAEKRPSFSPRCAAVQPTR